MLTVTNSCGQTTALYDASYGLNFMDPDSFWGWTPHNIASGFGSGFPLAPDPGTRLNASAIDDNSTSTSNPFYSQCVDVPLPTGVCSVGPVRDAAKQYGWRYSTSARFAIDHSTAASMGLSLWLDNRGYFVLFELDSNGDLRATILNPTTTVTLTSGGTGDDDYHDIALVYHPGAQSVSFEFDGVVRGSSVGAISTHDNAMLWGNLSGEWSRWTNELSQGRIRDPVAR